MTSLAFVLSALMYVIVDFDIILKGFIRIDHQSLELLVKDMEATLLT